MIARTLSELTALLVVVLLCVFVVRQDLVMREEIRLRVLEQHERKAQQLLRLIEDMRLKDYHDWLKTFQEGELAAELIHAPQEVVP